MTKKQKILVFQQNGSGEKKIEGIKQHGKNRFSIEIISIDNPLPAVIDDAQQYIPQDISADLVLDFLNHPDISHDLAAICRNKNIPVVASGKKMRVKGVHTPPT
jgi:thymidylate synthase